MAPANHSDTEARTPTPTLGWKIEQPEYDARVAKVREAMEDRGLDALVLFHPTRLAYVSGFFDPQMRYRNAWISSNIGIELDHLDQAVTDRGGDSVAARADAEFVVDAGNVALDGAC